MKNIDIQTLYKLLFADYPDIVTVRQLQVMLGISRHAAYDLLTDGSIRGLKLGNAYKIPKINVIRYVVENGVQPAARAAGWFEKKGAKTVLFCRCVPILRSLISIPAGMVKMNFTKYTVSSVCGIFLWNLAFVGAGYFFGDAAIDFLA